MAAAVKFAESRQYRPAVGNNLCVKQILVCLLPVSNLPFSLNIAFKKLQKAILLLLKDILQGACMYL